MALKDIMLAVVISRSPYWFIVTRSFKDFLVLMHLSFRLLLEKNHKDESKCCEVLRSVDVLLQHVNSEEHYKVIRDTLENIVTTFW